MSKREQFNLTTTKFSQSEHDYIQELANARKLSDWVARKVRQELEDVENTVTGSSQKLEELYAELKAIKQLLLVVRLPSDVSAPQTVQSVEAAKKPIKLISDEDLNYSF